MLITITIAAWIFTAMADYWFHRKSGIERTGLLESFMHLALISQVAIAVGVAIFLPPAPWIAVFLVGMLILHALASLIDIGIATARRQICKLEHAMHYGLNICPVIVAADYIAEYPLPTPLYVTVLLAAIAVLVIVPYLEEFVRCWRNWATE